MVLSMCSSTEVHPNQHPKQTFFVISTENKEMWSRGFLKSRRKRPCLRIHCISSLLKKTFWLSEVNVFQYEALATLKADILFKKMEHV